METLSLLVTSSAAQKFNILMLNKKFKCEDILINRVTEICTGNNVNFIKTDIKTDTAYITKKLKRNV